MPNEFPVPPHVKVCPSESGSEPVISKEMPEHCSSALSFSPLTYESRLNVFPLILLSVKSFLAFRHGAQQYEAGENQKEIFHKW